MTTTIKSKNADLLTLLAVSSLVLLMAAQAISVPYFSMSKIDEGEVVVRNDSVTTVVIPDKR